MPEQTASIKENLITSLKKSFVTCLLNAAGGVEEINLIARRRTVAGNVSDVGNRKGGNSLYSRPGISKCIDNQSPNSVGHMARFYIEDKTKRCIAPGNLLEECYGFNNSSLGNTAHRKSVE